MSDPTDPTQNLEIGHGTEAEIRWEGAYALPGNRGTFLLGVFKHTEESGLSLADASPIFEQTLAHPLYAGVRDDFLADMFSSNSRTKLREEYLQYHRKAFRSPRTGVDWFVGWRRVEHDRKLSANYFSLSPGLPSIPNDAGIAQALDPRADFANIVSKFEGRGATVGVDLEFNLWRNKVVLDSGVAITMMRGKTDASFTGENAVYLVDCGEVGSTLASTCTSEAGTLIDKVIVVEDPDTAFDEQYLSPGGDVLFVNQFITQVVAPVGVQAESVSSISEVYDVHLGFRWRALKWLEPFAGLRMTHYADVGIDLRPTGVTVSEGPGGIEFQQGKVQNVTIETVDRVDTSVTYEGFFFGVTIRLY